MNIIKMYYTIKGYKTAYLIRYNKMPFLKVFRYDYVFRTLDRNPTSLTIRNYDRGHTGYIDDNDLVRIP